ncbi:MAG: hypothetical protein JKY52_02200 [Flavobacteriales bacterium]|nr:hypothetical protein [Flavobacteriales bacterium]
MAGSAFAQAPKYSNEFLSIGVGARSLAMGNSSVAHVDDVTAGFWNPAGLNELKSDVQIGYMHNEFFAGIAKYDYGAIAARTDATTVIGFTPLLRLGIDNIPDTSELIDASGNINYDRIKSFSAADYAFIFSYAKKSKIKGLTYGGNAKVVHRKVGEFATAWGFGLDFGTQYQVGTWKFGAMGRDITSTFNAWSFNTEKLADVFTLTGNEIPENSLEITLPRIILGAGKMFTFSEKFNLYSEIDLDVTFDGKRNVLIRGNPISIDPHMGIELGYGGFAFLRAGVSNIQQTQNLDQEFSFNMQPNLGLGVKLKSIHIDYALTNVGQNVGLLSNVFSLKLDINKRSKPDSS